MPKKIIYYICAIIAISAIIIFFFFNYHINIKNISHIEGVKYDYMIQCTNLFVTNLATLATITLVAIPLISIILQILTNNALEEKRDKINSDIDSRMKDLQKTVDSNLEIKNEVILIKNEVIRIKEEIIAGQRAGLRSP
jgi:ABC-type multidrug transport system fused ATPase/permease subunit